MANPAEKVITDSTSYMKRAHTIVDALAHIRDTRQQWALDGQKPSGENFPSYKEPILPHQFLAIVQGCPEVGPEGVITPVKDGGIGLDDSKVNEGIRQARGIIESFDGLRNDEAFEFFKILFHQANRAFQGGEGGGKKSSDHRKAYMHELSALHNVEKENLLERVGQDESANAASVDTEYNRYIRALESSDRAFFYGEAIARLQEVKDYFFDGDTVNPTRVSEEAKKLDDESKLKAEERQADSDNLKDRHDYLEAVTTRIARYEGREKPFKALEIFDLKPNSTAAEVVSNWDKLNQAINDIQDEENREQYQSTLSDARVLFDKINTEEKLQTYIVEEIDKGRAFLELVQVNSGDHDPANPGHLYRRLGIDDESIRNGRLPEINEIKQRAIMLQDYIGNTTIQNALGTDPDDVQKAKKLVSDALDFLSNAAKKDQYDALLAKHYGFIREQPTQEEKNSATAKGQDDDCQKKSKGLFRRLVDKFNELPAVKRYVAFFYNSDKGNLIRGITRTAMFGIPGLAIMGAAAVSFIGATAALTPIGWPFLGLVAGWYAGVGFMQSAGDSFVKVYMSLLKIRKRDFDDRLQNLVERPIDSELFLYEFRDVINQYVCRVNWPKNVEEQLWTYIRKMRKEVDKGVYGNLGEAESMANKIINTLIENPVYSTYDIREQMLGINHDLELAIRHAEDDIATLEAVMDRDGSLTPEQMARLQDTRAVLQNLRKQTGNVKKNLSMRLVAAIELELKASKLFKLDVGGENLGIMDVEQKKKVLQGDLNELVQRWGPQKAQNFEGIEESLDSVGGQLAHLEYFFPFGLLARGGLKLREIPVGNPLLVQR